MTYFSQIHLSLILLIVPLFRWVFLKRRNLKLNLNFLYIVLGWLILSLYPYLQNFTKEKLILLEGFSLGLIMGTSWLFWIEKLLRRADVEKIQNRVFAKMPLLIGLFMMTLTQLASSQVGLGVFWLAHGLILPLVLKRVIGNTKKIMVASFIFMSPAVMYYVQAASMGQIEKVLMYTLLSISFVLYYFALSEVESMNAKNS